MKNFFSYLTLLCALVLFSSSNPAFAQGKEDDVTTESKAVKAPKTKTSASDKPAKEGMSGSTKVKEEKTAKSAATTTNNVAKVDKVNDATLASLKFGKKRKLGDKAMAKGFYYDAADYYQSAVSDKPKKWKMLWRLAEANLYSRNYASAANYYNQLSLTKKGLKKFPITKYKQGIALKQACDYTAAKEVLNAFVSQESKKDAVLGLRRFARKEIAGIEMVDTLKERKPMYRTSILGQAVNSGYEEFAPFVKGSKMFYTSRVTGEMSDLRQNKSKRSYYSIFESSNSSGDWTYGVANQDGVNKQMADVKDPFMSPDGKYLYYTRTTEDAKGKYVQSKIFVSENDGNGWSVGRPLNENINDPLSNSKQAMITTTADGKEVLYFASNRLSGKGGYDIFYSTKGESGEFGRAKSAGGAINTIGDELTPFFDNTNNKLYFSSNGHMTMGGLDVFSSTLNSDGTEWSDASHLGVEVNSCADDYYFRPDAANYVAYMASNRSGGQAVKCPTCTDDLYKVIMLKGNVLVMGTVNESVNGISNVSPDAKVMLFNADNGQKITETTVVDGRFSFDVEKENANITLVSEKKDFEMAQVKLNIGDYKEASMITNLTLNRTFTYVGTKIGTVFFDYDEFKLRPESPDTLNKIVAFMKQFPKFVVEVSGHTDDIGPDIYNDSLSLKRATAVNRYILSKDIAPSSTVVKALGKSRPIAPNKNQDGSDSPEGRALNRRVEFTVIEELK